MRSSGEAPVTIRHLSGRRDNGVELARDVAHGLTVRPKHMPSKWFYDRRGSMLFDDITRLPEYYLTRAETEILETHADDIIQSVRPDEIMELGSGYSVKTKLLIDAMHRGDSGSRYVPIDISEDALWAAARHLCTYYPWLAIDGLVGDYFTELDLVERRGRRLVTFLGSTIGNYDETERKDLLAALAAMLDEGDALLVGMDLVKGKDVLLAAYDDAAGVTAEFNRNMLHVLNRELDADFDVDAFDYVAEWNDARACVEMGLRATRPMTVHFAAMGLHVTFEDGEVLHNEVSCKFTRDTAADELDAVGLGIDRWFTDRAQRFALALARRS